MPLQNQTLPSLLRIGATKVTRSFVDDNPWNKSRQKTQKAQGYAETSSVFSLRTSHNGNSRKFVSTIPSLAHPQLLYETEPVDLGPASGREPGSGGCRLLGRSFDGRGGSVPFRSGTAARGDRCCRRAARGQAHGPHARLLRWRSVRRPRRWPAQA